MGFQVFLSHVKNKNVRTKIKEKLFEMLTDNLPLFKCRSYSPSTTPIDLDMFWAYMWWLRFCCCRYLDSWTCLCGPETSGSCTRKLPGSRAALREPLRELEVFPRGILRESRSAVNYWSESIGSNKLCRYLSLSYYQSINGVLIRVW